MQKGGAAMGITGGQGKNSAGFLLMALRDHPDKPDARM
jgi:hypothetical protein